MSWARRGWALVAAAPLLLGVVVWSAGRPALAHDRGFRLLTPQDGATVGSGVVVSWTARRGAASYALVVDVAPPPPGAVVRASPHVMTLPGRALALTLGAATSGSPSARSTHRLTVLPVDDRGRRIGEDVATVRVRARA